jgi:hypothetical protein
LCPCSYAAIRAAEVGAGLLIAAEMNAAEDARVADVIGDLVDASSTTRRRPDAKATLRTLTAQRRSESRHVRSTSGRSSKMQQWCTCVLPTALIEEGNGQENRRLARFPSVI